MKVEQQDSEFRPITITLETREEAQIMYSIMENYTAVETDSERRLMIDIANAMGESDF